MEHAILVLAHDNPAGLVRLISRLGHDRVRTFVHLDRKTVGLFDVPAIQRIGASVISTRKVYWSGFSSCLAQLDLLRVASSLGPFHTYSLISGRDYPCKRVDDIVREFDAVDTNLIDHWHDEDPTWHRRYARPFFFDYPAGRILNALSRRAAPYLPRRTAPAGLKVYFGWAWWTLLQDGVEAVFRFANERPDVVRWYRLVYGPDESFFQTALKNVSNAPRLSRGIRRFIRFPNASAHPKTIDHQDLAEALSGRYWFMRKVDESKYPGILDRVDEQLDGNRAVQA